MTTKFIGALGIIATGVASWTSTAVASEAPVAPLVFGVMAQDTGPAGQPPAGDGIEAWAWAVNEDGGLGGRPVEIVRCDDASNSERNQSCARDLINDPSVVGVIGASARFNGGVAVPLFEEAGLGYVCSVPLTAGELTASNALCVAGGAITEYAGLTRYFVENDQPRLAFIRIDAETGVGVASLIEQLAEQHGGELVADIAVAAGAPDLYPAATAALGADPDVILVGIAPADTIALMEALDSIGDDVPVASIASSLTAEQAALAGESIDGVFVASGFPTTLSDQAEADALAAALEASAGVDVPSGSHTSGWAAGRAVESIVNSIGPDDVTRESFLQFIQNEDVEASALFPSGLSRSVGAEVGFDALANRGVYIGTYDGEGVITTLESDPVDGFGE